MSIFLTDTFTAPDGTLVVGHAADIGGVWTDCGFNSSANAEIQSNRWVPLSGGANSLYNNQAAGSQDYTVTWENRKGVGTGYDFYLGVRFDPATKNGYIAGIDGTGFQLDFYRLVNGSPTSVASRGLGGSQPSVGDTWNYELEVVKSGSSAILNLSVQRSDGLWLTSSSTWQVSKTVALTYTDTSPFEPALGGYVFTWADQGAQADNIVASSVDGPLLSSLLTATLSTASVGLSVTPAGGSSPYSVDFHRGTTPNFVASGATLLATVAGSSGAITHTDSTGVQGTTYWYRAIITDSGVDTITPPTISAARLKPSLGMVFLGDSNIYGSNTSVPGGSSAPPNQAKLVMEKRAGPRTVTASNQGHGGAVSADFISGSSYLNTAKSAATALATDIFAFFYAIGTNDAAGTPVSKATFKANVLSAVNDLRSSFAGAYIYLNCPIYTSPEADNGSNFYSAAGIAAIAGYRDALLEIVTSLADPKIVIGDNTAFETFASHISDWYAVETFGSGDFAGLPFYLHTNDTGATAWAELMVSPLANTLNGVSSVSVGTIGYIF